MATIKQKRTFKAVVNGSTIKSAMVKAGYSEKTAKRTNKVTRTKGWEELMQQELPDGLLAKKHRELLDGTEIDHMVFPLNISDEEITELLVSANCLAKKFMHSETQTHVWFFAPDNKAKKDALDMAYKLKGKYAPDKHLNVNVEVEANPEIKALTQKLNELYSGASSGSDGGQSGVVGSEA